MERQIDTIVEKRQSHAATAIAHITLVVLTERNVLAMLNELAILAYFLRQICLPTNVCIICDALSRGSWMLTAEEQMLQC